MKAALLEKARKAAALRAGVTSPRLILQRACHKYGFTDLWTAGGHENYG